MLFSKTVQVKSDSFLTEEEQRYLVLFNYNRYYTVGEYETRLKKDIDLDNSLIKKGFLTKSEEFNSTIKTVIMLTGKAKLFLEMYL